MIIIVVWVKNLKSRCNAVCVSTYNVLYQNFGEIWVQSCIYKKKTKIKQPSN